MPNDHAVPTRRPPRSEKVPTFDAQLFLTSVGTGRSTTKYGPQSTIFLQGDPADAVFYIEKGTVQLTVVSEHGREGVIAMPSAGRFLWRRMPCRSASAHSLGYRHVELDHCKD
jgi:CRP-like cAMP-binding protein